MSAKPHIRLRAEQERGDGFHVGPLGGTSHDGASITARDMAAWAPPRRSADAEILPEWGRLTGRSRDLDRNSPVARGARRTITDNIIGSGLRLSSRPDYVTLGKTKEWAVEFAQRLQTLFCSWWWTTSCHAGDTLNGDQIVTIAAAAEILNGNSVTLPLWIPERADGYATKLQLVEADRLSNPQGQVDGRYLRGGIQIDDYGAPVGYHIQKAHPGDFLLGGMSSLLYQWEFIPRRTDFGRLRVIHTFDPDRSEQNRGKPLLTTIIPHLKQIDRYGRAELDAAVVNAMVAGIITTPLDQDSILELFNRDHALYLRARNEHAVSLESGSLLPLFPGDQFASHTPSRPAAQFGAFCENIYRIVGCALDLPYELLIKDFSKTTYTSGRMALLEAWRSFNRRRDWLGTTFLDPVLAMFAEEMVYAGKIEAPGFEDPALRFAYLRCRWIGPGRGWVDPVKEAQGANLRILSQLSTLEDECADQGKDWREVLEQIATENKERERLGLPLVTPTAVRETIQETPQGVDAGAGAPAQEQTGQQQAAQRNGSAA